MKKKREKKDWTTEYKRKIKNFLRKLSSKNPKKMF